MLKMKKTIVSIIIVIVIVSCNATKELSQKSNFIESNSKVSRFNYTNYNPKLILSKVKKIKRKDLENRTHVEKTRSFKSQSFSSSKEVKEFIEMPYLTYETSNNNKVVFSNLRGGELEPYRLYFFDSNKNLIKKNSVKYPPFPVPGIQISKDENIFVYSVDNANLNKGVILECFSSNGEKKWACDMGRETGLSNFMFSDTEKYIFSNYLTKSGYGGFAVLNRSGEKIFYSNKGSGTPFFKDELGILFVYDINRISLLNLNTRKERWSKNLRMRISAINPVVIRDDFIVALDCIDRDNTNQKVRLMIIDTNSGRVMSEINFPEIVEGNFIGIKLVTLESIEVEANGKVFIFKLK